ncbi:MAG: hypothetical protein KGL46_13810 [Hyphomicrobiales bacterium]|nr:hypothetical protein [Hyphomicrobiales bacterium]
MSRTAKTTISHTLTCCAQELGDAVGRLEKIEHDLMDEKSTAPLQDADLMRLQNFDLALQMIGAVQSALLCAAQACPAEWALPREAIIETVSLDRLAARFRGEATQAHHPEPDFF